MKATIPYPASLWRRLAAAIYDLFLLLAVWFLAVLALLPFTGGQAPAGDTWWFRAYVLFVPFLFFGWFWTHGGQTLGMKAWRMRLRRADGGPVTWERALLRYLGAWLAWPSVIGVLWILFDPRRRGWQDMVSGTEVIVESAQGP